MSRSTIELLTIEQWMRQPPQTRAFVLQNIKLRDRLHKYLFALNGTDASQVKDPVWVRCSKCADSKYPGYLLKEPRYDGLHPSAMGHPCLLKVYNDIVGVPGVEKVEPRLRLIFDLGHAVHHMFQTYGLNGAWGPEYKHEVAINAESQSLAQALMIEGHADAENILIIDEPDYPFFEVGLVHEYKSINDAGFKKLTRPKPEHKQQAMLYAAALNRPIVVYLYLNKNDSSITDFPVQFEPELWGPLQSKATLLVDYYKRETPPKGEVGFHCNDCPYKAGCVDWKSAQPRNRS